MRSIISLSNSLRRDYPHLSFIEADECRWVPDTQTVHFNLKTSNASAQLLHEVSHAVLHHNHYDKDISLLAMERDAWEYAQRTLGPRYGITIGDDIAQEALDTYRDWLHARSTCPRCSATGIQTKHTYTCLACRYGWRVNEARICSLRRYKV